MLKKLTKREQIELTKNRHYKWLQSLGLKVNMKTGHIIKSKRVSKNLDTSYLKVRNSIPTSDRIPGACVKRTLPKVTLPEGKTIGIAYNKGNYQIVDRADFKSMGRKI
jgi:hypothetical protein